MTLKFERRTKSLASLLFLTLLLAGLGCKRKPPVPAHLILITVDTLRPDRIGAYGREGAKTPHIDALAETGTSFTHAYAPMARTTPALASLMTGLWPHHHGSREVHREVKRGTFLATPLKKAGFASIAIDANPAAGRKQGFDVDFDVFQENLRFTADAVTDRAIKAVRSVPEGERVFLWAHYFDPHWPYEPAKAWRRTGTAPCQKLSKLSRGIKQSNQGGHAAAALGSCWNAYDSEIEFVDHEIGRLLDALRESGHLENAVVVFTSDHGENFGEDGLFFAHGRSVHDAGLRVPLIVAGPGIRQGEQEETLVRLIDLAPTMLSLLAVAPEQALPGADGLSFASVLREASTSPKEPSATLAFAESGGALIVDDHTALLSGRPRTGYCLNDGTRSLCWKGKGTPALYDRREDPRMKHDLRQERPDDFVELERARRRWEPGKTRQRAVSDGHFKLIERPRLGGGYARSLYELRVDPSETQDVQRQFPAEFARLAEALDAWVQDVPGYVPEALTDQEEAQLKALGYVE